MTCAVASVAVLAIAGAASAAVTVSTPESGYPAIPTGQTTVVSFDGPNAAGYSYTSSAGVNGTGVYQTADGLHSGVAAVPFGDTSTSYFAVTTGGHLDLTTPVLKSLSVFIGSLDSYNSITFKGLGGFSQAFSGSTLAADVPVLANGDQTSSLTNRRFDFQFNGAKVNEVLFNSTGNSFEFDTIAAAPAGGVPEPATWAMMMAGVFGVGAALRRSSAQAAALAV
jgi:hypothetical protein